MGFNEEPIFQPTKCKSCNYATMLKQLKNVYVMQTRPSRDDNLIGGS
jgi:hypothetical protein